MPGDRFVLRVSVQKLLIGLSLTLLPLSLFGLFAIHSSDVALEESLGNQFQTISEGIASEVSLAIHDMVRSAGVLAVEPSVLETIRRSNQSYTGLSPDAVAARIQAIDKAWTTQESNAKAAEILSSPTSEFLRLYRERDSRLLRITVTDEKGATVAATHRTLDYYQADEDYWQNIYAGGRGAIALTDVLYDDLTKSHYIGIGVPVLEAKTDRFLGTVDVLAEVSATFSSLSRVRPGDRGRALLVKEDGTVIAGPGVNLGMNVKSAEWLAVLDRLGPNHGRTAGYLLSDLRQTGRTLIGYADTGLKRDYGRLSAYVVIAQPARDAFAPLRGITRLIAFMSLLGIAMVTMLAMYFALHRRQPLDHLREEAQPQRVASKG
jgi:hypothetical protein